MKIVIMGCGRVGARIAGELENEGHEVSVIDYDDEAFLNLLPGFSGRTVVGNGVDKDVQREAGAVGADIFMALANGDNRNAAAAQVAKHINGVPRVVARIFDPERAEVYRELGVHAVNPTVVVTNLVRDAAFGP
ncbi:MAG: TrkA family potassium uptake protein [Dehalococcoidia bacterium]